VAIQLQASARRPGCVGVDFSPKMLAIGLEKVQVRGPGPPQFTLSLGTARKLPVKSESVDALTIAFGIRNIQERRLTLAEFAASSTGGQLLIMRVRLSDVSGPWESLPAL